MAGEELILATVLAIILIVVILRAAVKVVREYERLVIFRLGRLLAKPKGPGLTWIIPIFDRRVLIDLRTVAFDVPRQRVVSRDNVSVEVDAVVYYRVYDPLKAVTEVQNYIMATNLLAQTTLRDVLGQVELDELLSKREELSKRIQVLLDISTEPWGIKVQAVTLRDVSLPDTMVRAIAKQAEAERERRARVSMAEGEYQAAEKMREAAMIYGSAPSAMRLRELQTLTEIAREKSMIVVTNTTAAGDITGEVASLTAALARKGDKQQRRDVPILGWVGPVGAHAWSAGTILLVSTDLAAMAPGTTISSVQPVEVGPGGVVPVTDPKIINAVVTAISEELALHNRPIDLASAFVVDNLNLNATQAQSRGATELVAPSAQEFASLASGRRVVVQSNGTVYKDFTLKTAGAEIVPFSSSSRVSLLRVLSDPLVSSLLLILGIYLVIFGISAPGHGAEIAGVIVLLLALIGLGFSVDPIALLLFIVGVVLIIVEVKTPGHGVFGIGGIIAIILAAAFLAPLRPPRFVASPAEQLYVLRALLTPTGFFGGFLLFRSEEHTSELQS